jgi:hypothetical protein
MMDNETNTILDTAEAAREPAPGELRGPAGTAMKPEEKVELLAASEAQQLRSRWEKIQTGFVDEPRKAVQDADALVAQTTKQLADSFSRERTKLEQEWDRGDNVSTENLRIALRRYRSFFDRLLAM